MGVLPEGAINIFHPGEPVLHKHVFDLITGLAEGGLVLSVLRVSATVVNALPWETG